MDPYTTLTDATCEFSKSPGSALCAGFEPRVRVFTERRLDGDYHFFLVDVIFIKSCEDDRVVSRGAMIVTGVFSEGYRSIIGVMIGDTECFTTWDKIFRWLKGRGLKWVMFVITDDHGGLAQAVKKYFQGASWQRCQVHLMCNLLRHSPMKVCATMAAAAKLIFQVPYIAEAKRPMKEFIVAFAKRAPRVVSCLEAGFEDAMTIRNPPENTANACAPPI